MLLCFVYFLDVFIVCCCVFSTLLMIFDYCLMFLMFLKLCLCFSVLVVFMCLLDLFIVWVTVVDCVLYFCVVSSLFYISIVTWCFMF